MSMQKSRLYRLGGRRGAQRFRQSGVAGIVIAVILAVLVPLLGVGIEVGRLYYAQRELEKIAMLSSLDAARVASGCASDPSTGPGAGIPATLAATQAAVNASITANTVGATSIAIQSVQLGYTRDAISDRSNKTGRRIFIADTSDPGRVDSVRVVLTAPQPTLLFNFSGVTGSGPLFASATARQSAIGTLNIGSNLLNVDPKILNQLLAGLLCAANDTACQSKVIALNLADSRNGLANATVSLGDIGTAAGVADLSNPLNLSSSQPALNTLLNGLSNQVGGQTSELLRNLAAASSNPNGVPLGQVLGAVDSVAAAAPFVNLLDLVMALGEAANADPDGKLKPLQLPVGVNIPGVAAINVYLKIISPPQTGSGRAGSLVAHTAQVVLQIRIVAGALVTSVTNLVKTVLGVALGNLQSISNIGIDVEVAPGTASLDRLQCPTPNVNGGFPVAGLSAQTSVATIQIGTFSGAGNSGDPVSKSGSINLLSGNINLGLAGSATLAIALNPTSADAGATSAKLTDITQWTHVTKLTNGDPLPSYFPNSFTADGTIAVPISDNPQTLSSTPSLAASVALQTPLISNCKGVLCLTGGLLNALLTPVNLLLDSLISAINGLLSTLIAPLLQALGVTAGSATVMMEGSQVGQPEVISTCLPGDTSTNCIGT